MGRPKGALSKRTVEIAALLNRLEKEKSIDPAEWIRTMAAIIVDDKRDPYERIAAFRAIAPYRWGLPRAAIDLKTTHELGESFADVLLKIHNSNEHRQNLEALEQRRRKLPTKEIAGVIEVSQAT